jgi:hypothetical protein
MKVGIAMLVVGLLIARGLVFSIGRALVLNYEV